MQLWKAQIAIVGDSWLLIDDVLDLWSTTATVRHAPTAMHQWIYIYCSLQHARLRRRQENRTVYAALNLNFWSRTCGQHIVILKLMTDTKHRAASLQHQSYLSSPLRDRRFEEAGMRRKQACTSMHMHASAVQQLAGCSATSWIGNWVLISRHRTQSFA